MKKSTHRLTVCAYLRTRPGSPLNKAVLLLDLNSLSPGFNYAYRLGRQNIPAIPLRTEKKTGNFIFLEFSRTEAEHVQSEKNCDLKVDSDWLIR
ncbi:MAG: hypothetical protein QOH41_1069 [Blastocatellia bacterium]|jgi:hypothetical protein|nr:hypothetical protein [Blastocatellia bacterium]